MKMVYSMVRYVPGGVLRKALLVGGNFACVSFRQNVFHKGFVILINSGFSLASSSTNWRAAWLELCC